MAAKVDLNIDQGASFSYSINLKDSAGMPLNLTGYTGNAQLRTSYSANTYTTMDVSITEATGLVLLSMNAATTATLSRTRYLYDVELHHSGATTRLVEGFVNVDLNVTR
jgi:hypothetical protein